jgi:type I restriction enzyme, S subunit
MSSVPTGWASDRLKDVAAINAVALSTGTDPDYEFDYLEISNVDYHGIVDPNAIEHLCFEDAPSRARRRVTTGSTVISSVRPNLQAIAFFPDVPKHFVCSTGFNVVEPQPRKLSPHFAYFYLISENARRHFEAVATGVGYPAVGDKEFNAIAVPLPPLPEQQRIAAYLDANCAAIDAAVAAKRRQLETLDELRKSVAHQVLSEGLRPGLPLRDSGIESIGVIPAHWDVKQLRYACEVNYGITLQLEKGQSAGDGVRILTVSNLTIDGNLDLEDEYYIDPTELTKADYLRRGDLLFNWRNGSQYHVGKTAFFDMEGEVAHVSFLLRIRCGRHMYPFFLRSYLGVLKDAGFFAGAKDKVNKTFNSTELKRLRVVIPPMDEQNEVCREIERRTKECNDAKAAIESQITTLTAYRKSLIHECVTGQRRVTDEDVRRAGHSERSQPTERRP